jgi:serine/threonine-protein kinase
VSETLITDRRSASAHYKILRKLGKGGMAEVFLARQEGMAGLRRLTVVKKLLPQLSSVDDVSEMLLDEARIAAQLTHPNIVQIYELGKDEGQYFIAMEFVDGCDLATLARIERHRSGRVPLRLTLRVVAEAAMGLDYAHRQAGLDGRPLNIVHRDVSPHNILCSREGAVKVTDFGIAKAVGKAQVTQVGVVKGKVQYMAPEQYTGGSVDHRSDIFSLGVILYQLTVGRLPRVTEGGDVVMRRVVEGKIPRPSELRSDYPDELEAIVMRALAQNPDERFPDAASLRDDLLDFARDNDLLAFPKELGDYVNQMVPPAPLVVRERSVMHVPAEPSARPGASVSRARGPRILEEGVVEVGPLPAVMVEGEEEDTDAPQGTEVASPQGRRKGGSLVIADPRSRPYDKTELGGPDTDVGAPAVDDEQPTPAIRTTSVPARPREQEQRPRLRPVEPVQRTLLPADPAPKEAAAELPSTDEIAVATQTPTRKTERTRPEHGRGSLATWAAVVASLVAASTVVYLIAQRGPTPPPPPKEGSARVEPGAGVLSILSNPTTATVSVDGAQRCPSTPCQVAGLPLGRELVLTLRAPGHTLWMQRLVLTASEPKLLLRADLAPESAPPPARPDAKVRAKVEGPPEKKGGDKKGPAPKKGEPKAGSEPKPGEKKGPPAKSQGQVATVPLEPGNTSALLAVDVRPWAEVWVDGQKVGHTPLQRELKPGARVVELRNPELNFKKRYRIKAVAGKKVKISEVLQPPG